MSDVVVTTLRGDALAAALPGIARLRIAVFRAYPYLYDGDEAYERRYLAAYAASPGAVVIAAHADGRLVGAATAAPLEDHEPDFAARARALGLDPAAIFYFGESVLEPAFRGRRIGHAFFDAREAAARDAGRSHAAFCAVMRPDDHPARPADYRPLDLFWAKRGYAPVEGFIGRLAWRDLGADVETEKPMRLWMRALDPD